MTRSVLTIMLRFSASRHVFVPAQTAVSTQHDQIGLTAVTNVEWSEIHGDTETSISERWTMVANNIWLATLQKK